MPNKYQAWIPGNMILYTSQCESPGSPPWTDPEDSDIWKCLMSKSPPSFSPFVSEFPLFPTPGSGNLFILNVRTAPGSEHNCHNPLGGMSESCQNPLGCPWGPPGDWFTLTGALMQDIVAATVEYRHQYFPVTFSIRWLGPRSLVRFPIWQKFFSATFIIKNIIYSTVFHWRNQEKYSVSWKKCQSFFFVVWKEVRYWWNI